jgi:hypothetical protein
MLTARAILIGLLAVAVVCFLVSWAELVTGQIMIGFLQLPPVALTGLFLLALANKALRRLSARAGLRPPEIAAVYIMMILAAMLSSRGLMEDIIPMLVGVNYYANPGNRWQEIFFGNIPAGLVPWDPGGGALQPSAVGFFEGLREGEKIPWALWVGPLARWLVPVAAVFTAFLCLATLLRRQWSDNERLSFPLVQLPVEMIREDSPVGPEAGPVRSFFGNPLTWIGFALPAAIFGINGLHNVNPALPAISVDIDINSFFTSRPWSDITFFHAYVSLGSVGFFYLLPGELLLSFWFFHALAKLQDLLFSALAFPQISSQHGSGDGYVDYQTMGAYIVLVLYLGAMALPHLKAALKRAVSRAGPTGADELIPYRAAVWGLFISLAVGVLWLRWAGMALGYAAFAMLIYVFVEAIIMARGCAEAGLPMAEGSFTALDISALVLPPSALGARTLTITAFFDGLFARDLRGITLTAFLDGQKLSDEVGLRRRHLLAVFLIAIAAAVPIAAAIQLWLPYHRGAIGLYSYVYQDANVQFFRENATHLEGGAGQAAGSIVAFIAGGLITAWLSAMRVRYVGWPFHPLGYALCASWTAMVFWFPMFLAWLLKNAIVHYGGMRLYAKLRPLFLGMIFGEFTSAVLWTLIAATWKVPPPFFPWP